MGVLVKNSKRLFSTSPSGVPGGLVTDVNTLKNNEYKILYFQTISTATGTVTAPTGATILLDQFYSGGDAIVETLVNGQPSGQSPVTAGGAIISVSSFDTSGNYVLSGTPSSFDVALVYLFKIKAIDYPNVNITNVMAMDDNLVIEQQLATKLTKSGDTITGDILNTSTGYFQIASGTTAQRPVSPTDGMRRYNTTTLRDEFYANGSWQNHARLSGDTFTGTVTIPLLNVGSAITGIYPSSRFNINATGLTGTVFTSLNTTTTAENSIYFEQSTNNHFSIGRYNSGTVGNYSGSSIPLANTSFVRSGISGSLPLNLNGNAVLVTVGNTAGNYSLRTDAMGVRVGLYSDMHTANTVTFQVGTNFKITESTSTMQMGTSSTGQFQLRTSFFGSGSGVLATMGTFMGGNGTRGSMAIVPSADLANVGDKVLLAYHTGSAWASALEYANSTAANFILSIASAGGRVGIATASAHSTLHNNGSLAMAYVAKTANYTATINDYTIDCTSGTFTVTLPTAVGITGRIYIVKNSGTGAITVATTSSQTIDGTTTKLLNTQYSGLRVQSNGANWIIIGTI